MTLSQSAALRQTCALLFVVCAWASAAESSPEQRAIDYLAREVRAWRMDNGCFSCHNNGDGARALYTAAKLGYGVPADALTQTTEWLRQPAAWKKNGASPAISDQKLADIQFAAALADNPPGDAQTLRAAAQLVAGWQNQNGSWTIDDEAGVGSPVTWGSTLATYLAQRALSTLDPDAHDVRIKRARAWLRQVKTASLLDTSALLLALGKEPEIRRRTVDVLLRAQTGDGGWGPQPGSPAEPFDTALALLALVSAGEMNARGRAWLIKAQLDSGGWPPTTRPAGAQSYAQHISTSAWAGLALMATDPERK